MNLVKALSTLCIAPYTKHCTQIC